MKTLNSKLNPLNVAVTASLLVLATLPLQSHATNSSANSRVGITKVASLEVASVNNSELIRTDASEQMHSGTCFKAAGDAMPYRVSASSLANDNAFAVADDSQGSNIGYSVTWSNTQSGSWSLDSANDTTGVLSAGVDDDCSYNSMVVEIDDVAFNAAQSGAYTDTLSVMLIIE